MSAVFGREPSRPRRDEDDTIEAVVVDERGPDGEPIEAVVVDVPEGDEPEPVIDLRDDGLDDETDDLDDLDDLDGLDDHGNPADSGDVLDVEDLERGEDPDAAGEPAWAPEPEPEPEPVAEPEPAVVPATSDEPAEFAAAPGDAADGRWDDLQALFVDDPRAAVDGAATLVSEALAAMAPGDASTEDLRVAFRRYRDAFRDLRPG